MDIRKASKRIFEEWEAKDARDLNFGGRLSIVLEERGMSHHDLAKMLGVMTSTVTRCVDNGMLPTALIIAGTAKALGVSSDYLLGLEERNVPEPGPSSRDNDEWNPVSVRLPEESVSPVTMDYPYYMCTYNDGDVYDVRPYKFGGGHFWNGPGIVDAHITAWQERPDPYKGEKESIPVSWINEYLEKTVQSEASRFGIILMLGSWKEDAGSSCSADKIPMDWIRAFFDRTIMNESAQSGLLIMIGEWAKRIL